MRTSLPFHPSLPTLRIYASSASSAAASQGSCYLFLHMLSDAPLSLSCPVRHWLNPPPVPNVHSSHDSQGPCFLSLIFSDVSAPPPLPHPNPPLRFSVPIATSHRLVVLPGFSASHSPPEASTAASAANRVNGRTRAAPARPMSTARGSVSMQCARSRIRQSDRRSLLAPGGCISPTGNP